MTDIESFQIIADVAVFLNSYFKANESQASPLALSLTNFKLKLPFLMLSGVPNASWLYDFIHLTLNFIPTALLICTENSFWDIGRLCLGDNFMTSFKKSFTLYVGSGMIEKVEIDLDALRNEQGEFLVTGDFNAKFYKFIVDHYLRKFHCF